MKRKINMNRPEISSQEIAKRKNFDSVLKQANVGGGKPFFKKPWFFSGVVALSVVVVATVFVLNKNKASENTTDKQVAETVQPVSDTAGLAAFYKEEEAKPCISPPIAGLNVSYSTFKVSADKGGKFDYKTGSTITFPKNGFVDAEGKPVRGEVEIRYREFHDAVDFFVSGIPMTYDSAGTRYHFESAGMMEMLAYQDGKPVAMAPGKRVNVELASSTSDPKFNLYRLDTNINNWSCLGKDKVISKIDKPAPVGSVVKTEDITSLPEYRAIENKKVEAEKIKDVQIAALPKPDPEPKKPKSVRKGKYTFDIAVKQSEFPELMAYKGLLFEVGDENTNFSSSIYDVEWEDISLKQGTKPGENYKMGLKKGTRNYEFVVYPVYEGKNYETAMKEYQEKFKKYEKTLEKRIENEKRVEAEYQAALARAKAEEEALRAKRAERAKEEVREMDNEQKIRRMFWVESFGVYNCDSPRSYPSGVNCIVNLVTDKDRQLRCYDVTLVDKKLKGLFAYSRNPLASFQFTPSSRNLLWTTENGVLYYAKPEQFDALKNGREMQKLVMTKVDQKFNTVEEMKTYFAF